MTNFEELLNAKIAHYIAKSNNPNAKNDVNEFKDAFAQELQSIIQSTLAQKK